MRLHDAKTCAVIKEIGLHKEFVHAVAYSPEGDLVASGCDNGTMAIWSVPDGELVRKWKGHEGKVWALLFSRDGETLYSAAGDKMIHVWDVVGGKRRGAWDGHSRRVIGLSLDAAGTRLASVGADNAIRIWDVEAGTVVRSIEGRPGAKDTLFVVAFHPREPWVAAAGTDARARVWHVGDGTLLHAFAAGKETVYSIGWDAEGRRLAWGDGAGTVRYARLRAAVATPPAGE